MYIAPCVTRQGRIADNVRIVHYTPTICFPNIAAIYLAGLVGRMKTLAVIRAGEGKG